jgi:hypothetical protein
MRSRSWAGSIAPLDPWTDPPARRWHVGSVVIEAEGGNRGIRPAILAAGEASGGGKPTIMFLSMRRTRWWVRRHLRLARAVLPSVVVEQRRGSSMATIETASHGQLSAATCSAWHRESNQAPNGLTEALAKPTSMHGDMAAAAYWTHGGVQCRRGHRVV